MRPSFVRRRPAALLLAVLAPLVLLAACGADDAPVSTGSGGTGTTGSTVATTGTLAPIPAGADGLDDARARWEAADVADYEMTYREVCFCPETVVTVVVRDGEVADASYETDPGMGRPPEGLTVDDLFDELQRAVDEDAAEIRATYATDLGRPTSYWIDWSEMMADEEHGIDVTAFSVEPVGGPTGIEPTGTVEPGAVPPDVVTTGTSQPPSVRQVAQAQLTEPWVCGFGFAATDASHSVALVLRTPAPPPPGPSTVTLPAPGWSGEVQLGTDLLRVDCGDLDVMIPAAPDESWPVVGGTLQIDAPTPNGCTPSDPPARGTATNLTVEAPDGTRITFPTLALTNDLWGCSAG
jgi:hypothetical protein